MLANLADEIVFLYSKGEISADEAEQMMQASKISPHEITMFRHCVNRATVELTAKVAGRA